MDLMRKFAPVLMAGCILVLLFGLLSPTAEAVPYTIYGQVTWSDGSSPVAGATVTVTNYNRDPSSYSYSTTTDENGYYSITIGVLEPGDFANDSQDINITATYVTSTGHTVVGYGQPVVIVEDNIVAGEHMREVDISLNPVVDSTPENSFSVNYIVLLGILLAISLLLFFSIKPRNEAQKPDDEEVSGKSKGR